MLTLLGCQQEEIKKEKTGIVEATSSYLENFGIPPQGKAGQAYAAVGYLPVKGKLDQLGPLPIFLFTKENKLEKVLIKLVSGDLITTQKQVYYNPFPSDLEVIIETENGNIVTVDLVTKEEWENENQHAGIMALKETALQFNFIQTVKVKLNGTYVQGMPEAGFQKNSELMIEVPPPTLILMAGVWEEGQSEPEEILIGFDRPVKIQKFSLYHPDGQNVQGEYFQSIFDMAVVIHPESPQLFQEGTTVKAEWRVVDELGRENSGVDTMELIKYEH